MQRFFKEKLHADVKKKHILTRRCGDMSSSAFENLHAAAARSTFASQNVQNTQYSRTTFGSSDVETWHAAVARSTFASQNVKHWQVRSAFFKFRGRDGIIIKRSNESLTYLRTPARTCSQNIRNISRHNLKMLHLPCKSVCQGVEKNSLGPAKCCNLHD